MNFHPMLACRGLDFPPGLLLLLLVVLVGWVLSALLIVANLFMIFFNSSSRFFTLAHTGIVALCVGLTVWLFRLATHTDLSNAAFATAQGTIYALVFIIPAMVSGHFIYLKFLRRKPSREEIHKTYISGLFRGPVEPDAGPSLNDEARVLLAEATKLELAGQIREARAAYQGIARNYPQTTAGQDAQKSLASLQSQIGESP